MFYSILSDLAFVIGIAIYLTYNWIVSSITISISFAIHFAIIFASGYYSSKFTYFLFVDRYRSLLDGRNYYFLVRTISIYIFF